MFWASASLLTLLFVPVHCMFRYRVKIIPRGFFPHRGVCNGIESKGFISLSQWLTVSCGANYPKMLQVGFSSIWHKMSMHSIWPINESDVEEPKDYLYDTFMRYTWSIEFVICGYEMISTWFLHTRQRMDYICYWFYSSVLICGLRLSK